MPELLWLLVPVAAVGGWYIGKRGRKPAGQHAAGPNAEYFRGLNYLLNEQPDKAIEVFIRLIDVNSDTVETHLALGNLFRRRGETDRAIRIHQNLIARPTLNPQQRDEALEELGQDYMRAGLLDRAEGLFRDLASRDRHRETSLSKLLMIYQQERDWDMAIETARQLDQAGSRDLKPLIAHLYCERAEAAINSHDLAMADRSLKEALSFDGHCARASILRGDMARNSGDYEAAIRAYRRVERQDPDILPEVLPDLERCYEETGSSGAMVSYLRVLLERNFSGSIAARLARLIAKTEGDESARACLRAQLERHPSQSMLSEYLGLSTDDGQDCVQDLDLVADTVKILGREKAGYACTKCGFKGKAIHWQCPGCKGWGTIKPEVEAPNG